jgi:hypothetical protein
MICCRWTGSFAFFLLLDEKTFRQEKVMEQTLSTLGLNSKQIRGVISDFVGLQKKKKAFHFTILRDI